jgi:hypothetical protein
MACGDDPDAPVYDTVNNPNQFPSVAVNLIDDIESDQVTNFDEIVSRFADLYTTESTLLDNDEWKQVIDRLGGKFELRAHESLKQGITGYTDAASNFMLASFAHPGDNDLLGLSRLFSTWQDRVKEDSTGRYAHLAEADLAERVQVLRQFELADSVSRVFSREYLRPAILGDGLASFGVDQLKQLKPVDRCLLDYTGLGSYPWTRALATWGDPKIKLVAAEIKATRPGWYLAEMYFVADIPLEKDFTIALQAMTEDSLLDISKAQVNYIPFDFSPATPTSQWPEKRIMATAKSIYYGAELKRAKVGFYLRDTKESRLMIDGSDRALFMLKVQKE